MLAMALSLVQTMAPLFCFEEPYTVSPSSEVTALPVMVNYVVSLPSYFTASTDSTR